MYWTIFVQKAKIYEEKNGMGFLWNFNDKNYKSNNNLKWTNIEISLLDRLLFVVNILELMANVAPDEKLKDDTSFPNQFYWIGYWKQRPTFYLWSITY